MERLPPELQLETDSGHLHLQPALRNFGIHLTFTTEDSYQNSLSPKEGCWHTNDQYTLTDLVGT